MSRGLGKLQRAALDVVTRDGMLDSIEIAGRLFDTKTVSPAQDSATRRALRGLAERGALTDMGRYWRGGRRHWATPDEAARYRERVRAVFGRPA